MARPDQGFEPTGEQQRILRATGRVIKINARAGTGKTETLRLIAQNHPGQKILYLVFNRKNREEAEKRFPGHVQVRSLHAFALASLAGLGKRFAVDPSFTPWTFLPDFAGERDGQILSFFAHDFLGYFLNSPLTRLEEALAPYGADKLTAAQRETFAAQADRIVAAVRRRSAAWNRGDLPCPHDFYLKLAHLRGAFQEALDRFALILVDEGQDLSPVMLDALARCPQRIVLVGDSHQGIYSFRHAVDAMAGLKADQAFDLSLSFRFGEPVAALAERLVVEATGETRFRIRGNPARDSEVRFCPDLAALHWSPGTAILSRTNLGLFRKAMFLRAKGVPYRFERDIKADLLRILDIHRLHSGERERIKDPWIASFGDSGELDRYAERLQDFRLANMVQIVRQYAEDLPAAVFKMLAASKRQEKEPGGDGAVILSTVHTAKGQQYRQVVIDEDVAEALGRTAGKEPAQLRDEVNVAYVCLTRVEERLWLPEAMKTVLTPDWQAYARGLASTTARQGQAIRRRMPAVRPDNAPGFAIRSEARPAKANAGRKAAAETARRDFRIGDRVRTANGYGIVEAVEKGQCRIALEGQAARIWERATALLAHNP